WFCFDCGNYYGSEHYGGCGIQRRVPYCDPRPAYAAYAAMTDQLDQADFDGWLKTGSLNTYFLRFPRQRGRVSPLWTIRVKRPVTLKLAKPGQVTVTDSMNNPRLLQSEGKDNLVTIQTDPSVVYVTGATIAAVEAGTPDHSDAQPSPTSRQVA